MLAFVDAKYGASAERSATAMLEGPGGIPSRFGGDPGILRRAVEARALLHVRLRAIRPVPGDNGPFRTALAYQASRLDLDFYERFYRPEALSGTQRLPG